LGNKVSLKPNTLCVVKVPDISLFCEPIVQREQVAVGLCAKWMMEKATLKEWTQRFAIANSSNEALSDNLLKETTEFKELVKSFKTPIKSGQKESETGCRGNDGIDDNGKSVQTKGN
jgi:hypothetical protein